MNLKLDPNIILFNINNLLIQNVMYEAEIEKLKNKIIELEKKTKNGTLEDTKQS